MYPLTVMFLLRSFASITWTIEALVTNEENVQFSILALNEEYRKLIEEVLCENIEFCTVMLSYETP